MKAYGKKVWLIPDTYLNSVSMNASISHTLTNTTVCVQIVNSADRF